MPQPSQKISLSDIDTARIDIAAPKDPSATITYEALWAKFAQVSEEKIQLQSEVEKLRTKGKTHDALNELISPYANKTFWFMCNYCTFVAAILVLSCFVHLLPESVLQLLVGSTAVTVIGLMGMVLTGVFIGARQKSN